MQGTRQKTPHFVQGHDFFQLQLLRRVDLIHWHVGTIGESRGGVADFIRSRAKLCASSILWRTLKALLQMNHIRTSSSCLCLQVFRSTILFTSRIEPHGKNAIRLLSTSCIEPHGRHAMRFLRCIIPIIGLSQRSLRRRIDEAMPLNRTVQIITYRKRMKFL